VPRGPRRRVRVVRQRGERREASERRDDAAGAVGVAAAEGDGDGDRREQRGPAPPGGGA
jgi:hypothetical protein